MAFPVRPALRPADAVNVALAVAREVVVNDVADPLHVEAAGGDVSGDDDVEFARAKASTIFSAASEPRRCSARAGAVADPVPEVGQRLGRAAGPDEDDDAVGLFRFEDPEPERRT